MNLLRNYFNNSRVVLIADRAFKDEEEFAVDDDDLEMISNSYFEYLCHGFLDGGFNLVHYQSPSELVRNVEKHARDLVFTIFGGQHSRNRMALVPAVCEAAGIKFAGADTYARVLCQDKRLTKEYVRSFGIKTADYVILYNERDWELIKGIPLPLVIKPNFEGTSIGILDDSKVDNYEDAHRVISRCFGKYGHSVLVEEFLGGKELCICMTGSMGNVEILEAIEVFHEADPNYFEHHLYSSRLKTQESDLIDHRVITGGLSENVRANLIKLYTSLGKLDYLRIDGKLWNEQFYLIELTPDAYMGNYSAMQLAYRINGLEYHQMLTHLVNIASESYHSPYSSG